MTYGGAPGVDEDAPDGWEEMTTDATQDAEAARAAVAAWIGVGLRWGGYVTADGSPSDVVEPVVGRPIRAVLHGQRGGHDRIVWVRREW